MICQLLPLIMLILCVCLSVLRYVATQILGYYLKLFLVILSWGLRQQDTTLAQAIFQSYSNVGKKFAKLYLIL